MNLSDFTTAELQAELKRRQSAKRGTCKQFQPCDECVHFKTTLKYSPNLNPCQKGHDMSFRMPDGPIWDNWGFYRNGCEDRETMQS